MLGDRSRVDRRTGGKGSRNRIGIERSGKEKGKVAGVGGQSLKGGQDRTAIEVRVGRQAGKWDRGRLTGIEEGWRKVGGRGGRGGRGVVKGQKQTVIYPHEGGGGIVIS